MEVRPGGYRQKEKKIKPYSRGDKEKRKRHRRDRRQGLEMGLAPSLEITFKSTISVTHS